MNIDHVAIWVNDLEHMKTFYETYFEAKSGERYHNATKSFTSYFLTFEGGSRLELMHRPDISKWLGDGQEAMGLTHLAISVASENKVRALTEQLRSDGYTVIGEPRTTGDGYYESVILDPEGNRLEITV